MKRIGVIGAGGMGGTHVRHYAGLGTVELGLFDVDAGRVDPLVQKFGVKPFDSIDALLSWADAADICTPTPTHADLASKAIAAGRALLVEKPLAQTLAQARSVVDAAEKAGVPMMVGHVVRFFPEFRTANRLVREGRVGTPAAIRMRRGGGPPKADWFLDHSLSGGILVDLAVHDFDWLRWTFGEVSHLYARSVGARTGHGPDYSLTTMTFESGAVAHVETTWMDPSGGRATLEVCGSDGMLQYDSRQTAILRTHTAGNTRSEAPLSAGDDPYRNQLAAFAAGLETGEMPVTGVDGFMALSLGLAAYESAHSGRVIVPERY